MGCCLSTSSTPDSVRPSTAKVVALDGSLREYSVPVEASHLLDASSSSSSSFLCSSDMLYYDSYIPPMRPGDLLLPGQIYFLLPTAMLDRPLDMSDMAALALKASSALKALDSNKDGRRRRNRIQVMPFVEAQDAYRHSCEEELPPPGYFKSFPTSQPTKLDRKMGKPPLSLPKSTKVVSRLYRRGLSTIEEAPEWLPD